MILYNKRAYNICVSPIFEWYFLYIVHLVKIE